MKIVSAAFLGGVLVAGTLSCGDEVTVTSRYLAVSVSTNYGCGIRTDNSLWCWGGSPAAPQKTFRSHPLRVGADNNWIDVNVGWGRTCALKRDHSLWCWNTSDVGDYALPADIQLIQSTKVEAMTRKPERLVHGQSTHLCFFDAERELWCFGANRDGELGDGSQIEPQTYVSPPGGPWDSATSAGMSDGGVFGGAHTCALKGPQLFCWGDNLMSQIGVPLPQGAESWAITSPAQVEGEWKAVATGNFNTTAIRSDGTLWYWGHDYNGTKSSRIDWHPTLVSADTDWEQLASGASTVCGLKHDGSAWCWSEITIGTGPSHLSATPERVLGNHRFNSLSVASGVACGIDQAQEVWCWGNNWNRQLGDGTEAPREAPVHLAETLGE